MNTTEKRTDACSQPLCIYTQILAYKNRQKHEKKIPQKNIFLVFPLFQLNSCNFSEQCFQSFKKKFDLAKMEKHASKVAHNRPNTFVFTV